MVEGLADTNTVAGLALIGTVVVVILTLAALTYHFVEERCRRAMRRMPARLSRPLPRGREPIGSSHAS